MATMSRNARMKTLSDLAGTRRSPLATHPHRTPRHIYPHLPLPMLAGQRYRSQTCLRPQTPTRTRAKPTANLREQPESQDQHKMTSMRRRCAGVNGSANPTGATKYPAATNPSSATAAARSRTGTAHARKSVPTMKPITTSKPNVVICHTDPCSQLPDVILCLIRLLLSTFEQCHSHPIPRKSVP